MDLALISTHCRFTVSPPQVTKASSTFLSFFVFAIMSHRDPGAGSSNDHLLNQRFSNHVPDTFCSVHRPFSFAWTAIHFLILDFTPLAARAQVAQASRNTPAFPHPLLGWTPFHRSTSVHPGLSVASKSAKQSLVWPTTRVVGPKG